MQVEIVTPEAVLYSGEADMVIARGLAGEVGVLRDHEPMLVGLDYGEMRVYQGDSVTDRFAVYGGFLEVRDNVVSVLSDDAEDSRAIDVADAEAGLAAVDTIAADKGDAAQAEALKRAEVRLAVARGGSA
ncbi:MAG: ATP synthase F1 subunit epsilon [Acidimicrobiia bacterium]